MFNYLNRFPRRGWIGLGLVLIFWLLNWTLSGLRSHLGFFPLWLGYCLTVDSLVYLRNGNSLFTRNWRMFVGLFLLSAPAWWLFELINRHTQNWFYDGKQFFSNFQYGVLASLSFSTVMPAVFETSELVSTFNKFKKRMKGPVVPVTVINGILFLTTGLIMLVLLYIWPRYFYPFVWASIYFILEPLNVWLGNRSLWRVTAGGNWQPVYCLWVGVLICGFFWEMWNYFSYPKWIYHVPFVNYLNIFEMPILGYLGYLPFSLELFALYHFVVGFIPGTDHQNYIQFSK